MLAFGITMLAAGFGLGILAVRTAQAAKRKLRRKVNRVLGSRR
jgi:F0F1-type ATP synthase membrane subunit c/vacuolar-type H+-ATPase subunit K